MKSGEVRGSCGQPLGRGGRGADVAHGADDAGVIAGDEDVAIQRDTDRPGLGHDIAGGGDGHGAGDVGISAVSGDEEVAGAGGGDVPDVAAGVGADEVATQGMEGDAPGSMEREIGGWLPILGKSSICQAAVPCDTLRAGDGPAGSGGRYAIHIGVGPVCGIGATVSHVDVSGAVHVDITGGGKSGGEGTDSVGSGSEPGGFFQSGAGAVVEVALVAADPEAAIQDRSVGDEGANAAVRGDAAHFVIPGVEDEDGSGEGGDGVLRTIELSGQGGGGIVRAISCGIGAGDGGDDAVRADPAYGVGVFVGDDDAALEVAIGAVWLGEFCDQGGQAVGVIPFVRVIAAICQSGTADPCYLGILRGELLPFRQRAGRGVRLEQTGGEEEGK